MRDFKYYSSTHIVEFALYCDLRLICGTPVSSSAQVHMFIYLGECTYILHVDRYVWMISTCKIDIDRKIYVW